VQKLDANFFKPFVEGTMNTLKVQCSLEVSSDKPFVKGSIPQPPYAIAGVIGITSNAFNGTITLCFPEKVFLGVMGKMLGESFTEINQDLQDGVAELLNIIFGQAKIILNQQGYTIQKAIPNVIRGHEIVTTTITKGPVIVLPFKVEFGEFHIEIASEAAM
jgi:chemotaxis protein CheX